MSPIPLLPLICAGMFALSATSPASAQGTPINSTAPASQLTEKTSAETVDGEVRKVDKEAKKITIKHGEIPNLDMPGMTMVFQVRDIALLDNVKAGDKIKFKAEKINGAIVVTELQASR